MRMRTYILQIKLVFWKWSSIRKWKKFENLSRWKYLFLILMPWQEWCSQLMWLYKSRTLVGTCLIFIKDSTETRLYSLIKKKYDGYKWRVSYTIKTRIIIKYTNLCKNSSAVNRSAYPFLRILAISSNPLHFSWSTIRSVCNLSGTCFSLGLIHL